MKHRRPCSPRRRRQRGSTILYAIVVVTAVSAVAVANLELAGSYRRMQTRREDAIRMRYVAQAAQAAFQNRALASPAFTMSAQSITVSGKSYSLTYAAGTGPKAIDVTISTGGKVVGTTTALDPRGVAPQLYGLWTTDFDMDKRLVLGSPSQPTHAYFGKAPKKNPVAGSFIFGAVDSDGVDADYEAYGPLNKDQPQSDPATCQRLLWVPSESYLGSTTIGGRNVGGTLTSYSYLIYCGGKATVTGTFSGRITIFSKSAPILKAPIIVTPGSTLVVMTDVDADVQGQGEIDCHLYTSGKLNVPASAGVIDWTGSIVAKSIICKTALNLTLDPIFYTDPDQVEDFYLPAN